MPPRPLPDLTGQTFGRLTVLHKEPPSPTGQSRYLAQCGCGSAPKMVIASHLLHGRIRSCGCLRAEHRRRLARAFAWDAGRQEDWMPDPFLDPEQIGDVSLMDALAAIDLELRLRDRVYPHLITARKLSQREAARRYRGLVGARRVVLAAMQLALPLDLGPGQALGEKR